MKRKLLTIKLLNKEIRSAVEKTPIIDIHTHLFPESFKDYYSSGLLELLNYHYLAAEYLHVTGDSPSSFTARTPRVRAERIWNTLFKGRTPFSEAARGVVTTLKTFGVSTTTLTFSELLNQYSKSFQKISEDTYFKKANVSHVVMTNNPFDSKEWALFKEKRLGSSRYLSSLRIDDLFYKKIKLRRPVKQFLKTSVTESDSRYIALSGSYDQLREITITSSEFKAALETAKECDIPIALFAGVKREINPDLGPAGDGVQTGNIQWIATLARKNPHIRFLVTCLSLDLQHELTVIAQKFSNITLFGCWWYLNTPSTVKHISHLRLDLLGREFIPQFSDARVVEHLIYKWHHFRESFIEVLDERYSALLKSGWEVTSDSILSDVEYLFRDLPASIINLPAKHGR